MHNLFIQMSKVSAIQSTKKVVKTFCTQAVIEHAERRQL
jgi:hypothetical protein